MIRVENVSRSYGQETAVKNISLTIPTGKIIVFIGPNGAGKSTLFSLLSRLLPLETGSIYIDDVSITDWKNNDLAKTLSILKQTNDIHIRLTVRDLVSFGRFPYSQSKLTKADWDKVEKAIEFMDLLDIQDKYLDELSGGQQQRAYIAMVIAQDTKYILLDEPLNNLDIKHAIQMMQTMQKMTTELGKTVLVIMHDINFAASYADYIVAMKKGELAYNGTVAEIMQTEILQALYGVDISVETVNGKQICLYT
jgi:ABC-type enterochelin transport system, ATPase component